MSELEYLDFVEISPAQLRAVEQLYNDESIINTIYNISVSGLTGGGVVFSRDGYQLTDYATRFYAHMWLEFARKLVLCLWLYGFAPIIFEPHKEFKAIPRILCLVDVSVRIRRTMFNTTEYVFLRSGGPKTGDGPMNGFTVGHREPVKGVLVVELDAPDAFGNLHSKMVYAWKEHQLLARHLSSHVQCVARMANPPLLVDRELGAKSLEAPVPAITDLGADKDAVQPPVVVVESGVVVCSSVPPTKSDVFMSGVEYVQRVERGGFGENLRMACAPQESRHMVDLILGYEERLSALFAVPRSFFAQFSAGRSANSPDAREMWRNSQRALKQLVCMFLEVVYDHIFIESHAVQRLAQADELLLSHDVASEKVMITLPGIPPEDVILAWWTSGVLKYESYRGYLSAMYGIPLTDLHETQQLTLQELNGIKESSDATRGTPKVTTVVQQEKRVNPNTGVSKTNTLTTTTSKDESSEPKKKRKKGAAAGE